MDLQGQCYPGQVAPRSAQEEAVAALLARRDTLARAADLARAALDALDGDAIDPRAIDLLVAHARRTPGEEDCASDDDVHGALTAAASARGGAVWLALRLGWLRAALGDRRQRGVGHDDGIRELYGELLDEHRDQPEALAQIREVGRLIDEAVERGDLPRALIRRAPR